MTPNWNMFSASTMTLSRHSDCNCSPLISYAQNVAYVNLCCTYKTCQTKAKQPKHCCPLQGRPGALNVESAPSIVRVSPSEASEQTQLLKGWKVWCPSPDISHNIPGPASCIHHSAKQW